MAAVNNTVATVTMADELIVIVNGHQNKTLKLEYTPTAVAITPSESHIAVGSAVSYSFNPRTTKSVCISSIHLQKLQSWKTTVDPLLA